MPRDGSGNYTLPSGNPVSPGATIESNWANSTMDDLAVAMTDSLSRSGSGSMLVPFQNIDGVESLPGITWAQEPSTGFFRETTGDMRWSVLSVAQGRMTTTNQIEAFRNGGFRRLPDVFSDETILGQWTFANGIAGDFTFTGQALGEDGDASVPTYSFTSSPDIGMYSSPNLLGFATEGVERLRLTASQARFAPPLLAPDGDATGPAYSFTGQTGTGMYRPGTSLGFTVNGADVLFILPNQMRSVVDGSATLPAWSFQNNNSTGMFFTTEFGPPGVAFAAGGVQQANFNTTAAFFANPVRTADGTAAIPSHAFVDSTNMGMYRESSAFLAFAVGGVRQARVATNSWQFFQQTLGPVGSAATPTYSFTGDGDTGMYNGAADTISWAIGGALGLTLSSAGLFAGLGVKFQGDGNNVTPATPAFTFSNDTDTGYLRVAANSTSIVGGGEVIVNFAGQSAMWMGAGYTIRGTTENSTVAPAFSFTNDTDTGMYRFGTNAIGFSAGNTSMMRIVNSTQSIDLLQTSATTGISIRFQNSAGVIAWSIDYEGSSGFQPKQLSFSYFNNVTGAFISVPFYIATNGRVHSAQAILTP